jgi:hypothetical protein
MTPDNDDPAGSRRDGKRKDTEAAGFFILSVF